MHEIFSHPPAISLSGGRSSSLSEVEANIGSAQGSDESIMKDRALKLREKAIGLMGEEVLEKIVTLIKSSHCTGKAQQDELQKVAGNSNMQNVEVVYKMLQAQSILDQLETPGDSQEI